MENLTGLIQTRTQGQIIMVHDSGKPLRWWLAHLDLTCDDLTSGSWPLSHVQPHLPPVGSQQLSYPAYQTPVSRATVQSFSPFSPLTPQVR